MLFTKLKWMDVLLILAGFATMVVGALIFF